jgi:hypothetical protein
LRNNSKGNLRSLGQAQEAQYSQEEFGRLERIFSQTQKHQNWGEIEGIKEMLKSRENVKPRKI